MNSSLSHFVRRRPPQIRKGVYELYWMFASRRQAAFEARLAGQSQPWTLDPILQVYKFCNVFRAADRVSQFMIRDVAYGQDAETSPRDRVFQITAFRTFSNIATWESVTYELGGAPRLDHLRSGDFERALDRVKQQNGGLYTGAFILCASKAFGFDEKHRNHVALFKHMFLDQACAERVLQAPSLEAVVELLQSFPLMGPFMAYQTAIDLNYSELLHFSENDYTQAGPGALRGLKKAFTDMGDYSPADAILWMVDRQEEEFQRLELPFAGLFGRRLHGIDCQGLFCELDKYCREAVPELASARSRIKAKYSGSGGDIELFFPPKWQLSSSGVVRAPAPREGSRVTVARPKPSKAARGELAVADLFT
ncbi:putative DNA base hypermodification protein [Mesorhizobium sp. VK4C]|uniref:nucleotide kinase domain-containing protein n=1 Tax=Mesorhizobium captivum TaxID=3072319 RepID=UPI002A23B006|nr:nucleotide kinase domain-containing protein [Mesorhizobium sp. VK4C]MDX8501905.1 putative DNA base hypermodification protein [Mesorhizobium sp. VK4C]